MSRRGYRSVIGEGEQYIGELMSGLRVGGRNQRRILLEVRAHFADIVAEEQECGLTRDAAVLRARERMGSCADLAEEFNRDIAAHDLRNAAYALAVCSAVAAAPCWAALRGWVPARPWPNATAFDLVTGLLVQVAIACAGIGLFLAVVAPWSRRSILGGRPAQLAGRSLTVSAVALAPVGVVAAGNVAGMPTAAARVLYAVIVVGVPLAASCGARAAARAPGSGSSSGDEQVVDVIVAVAAALAERWVVAAWAHRQGARTWVWLIARAPRLARWADLRRHPWRTALAMSAAAGAAVKLPDLVAKGELDWPAALIEAVAVFLCFVLLGGLLGLRSSRPGVSEGEVAS